jgi:hypothetical protein
MPPKTPAEVRELKALQDDPAAQRARAATLLEPRKGLAVIQAALNVLIDNPQPETKPALFELYAYYTEHEKRDPACYIRSQIVLALRPLATPGDLPFFQTAVETYVFPPPQFTEEGGLLRANALLVIGDLDDETARFAATRLLVDEHTAPMSGEPAVTAAQVLAGLDELLPLYMYAMQPWARIAPEVGTHALRGLAGMPESQLRQVVLHYISTEESLSPVLLTGLFDLILAREPVIHEGRVHLAHMMRTNIPLDLYRYLATLLVTCGLDTGWELFEQAVKTEDVPARRQILREALDVALDRPRAEQLASALEAG